MPSKQIKSEQELIESEIAALPKELLLNSVLLFEEENEAEHIAANLDETPKQEISEVEKNIEQQGQVLKLEDEDTETYYQKVKKEIAQYLNWRQEYVDNLRHKAQERLINSVKVTTKELNRISTKNKKGFKKASTFESSRTKRDKKTEKDGIKLNNRKNNTAAESAKSRKGLFDAVKIDSKKRLNTYSTRLIRHDIVKNTLSANKSKKRLDTDTTLPKRHNIARSALSADKSKKRLDTDTTFSKKHNIARSALSADKFKKSLIDGLKTDSKKNLDTGTKRSKKHCGPKSKLAIEVNYNVRRRSTKKRHIFQGYKGEGLISIKKMYENYKGTRQLKLFTMSQHKHQKMRAMDIKYERKKADNRFSMKI